MRDEVAELVRLGATYIQIDAPHYPLLLDPATRAFYESQGWTLEEWLAPGHRDGQCRDRRLPGCDVQLAPVPRQPGQPLAGRRAATT